MHCGLGRPWRPWWRQQAGRTQIVATVVESQGARRHAPARHGIGRASGCRVARVIWYREVLAYSRDRARLASSLVMPILMIVIFGEGFGSSIGNFQEGINYRQFIFPGVIAMTILFESIFSGVSIIWDREFGFLREILVAPISRTAIGMGKLLGGASIAMSQAIILFLLAPFAERRTSRCSSCRAAGHDVPLRAGDDQRRHCYRIER